MLYLFRSNVMKHLLVVIFSIHVVASSAQDLDLTVVGQGSSLEEARSNAVKSAIEQAFGAFVTSRFEVINDSISADEIKSISNGSIKKFKIISEGKINEELYFSNIIATVNKGQIISFSKSKGINVEYEGEIYAENIRLLEANKKNELIAWDNIKEVLQLMLINCVKYELQVSNPAYLGLDKYKIPYEITISITEQYDTIINILKSFCRSINLNQSYFYTELPTTSWQITKTKTLAQPLIALSMPLYPVVFSKRPINIDYFNEISQGRKQKIFTGYRYNEEPYFCKMPLFTFDNEMMIFRNPNVANEVLRFQFKFLYQIIANAIVTSGNNTFQLGGSKIDFIKDYFSTYGLQEYIDGIDIKLKDKLNLYRASLPGLILTYGNTWINFDYSKEGSENQQLIFSDITKSSRNRNINSKLSDNFELLPILNFLKHGKLFYVKAYDVLSTDQLNKIKAFTISIPKLIL